MTNKSFTELATSIGKLVEEKNKAYGNAFDRAGDFLRVLYPEGIKPDQYKDMLCIVRVFDKLMRIATSYEGTEEKKVEAYSDLSGYGLLGLRSSLEEQQTAALKNNKDQEEKLKKALEYVSII
jgi:selenophosphate synthase